MKFPAPSRSTSFYESFSDLIFATMAIFVLVVIVLIIQIRPKAEGVPEEKYEEAISELEQKSAENEEQKDKIEELEKKLEDSISTRAMELIVIVDGSGSMEQPLRILGESIKNIAESIPVASSDFSLGMIVYRNSLDVYAMRKILPDKLDGGKSYRTVEEFTRNMRPISAMANIDDAITRAVQMFSDQPSRKTLVVLGDMGPYEYVRGNQVQWECQNKARENSISHSLKQFSNSHSDFRVFTLFTGNGTQNLNCISNTRNFFRGLAANVSSNGLYSEDVGKLLVFLLKGVLGDS